MADELELDETGNPIVFFDMSLGGEFPFLRFVRPFRLRFWPVPKPPTCSIV
jgi:hypothetical protein